MGKTSSACKKGKKPMKKKLMVKEINFYGDTLKAAKDKDGIVWAGIKWLCDGMGLSEGQAKSERKKIQEDMVLSQEMKFHLSPWGTRIYGYSLLQVMALLVWSYTSLQTLQVLAPAFLL